MSIIKVANITEEGRYGGPQSRIAKVARILNKMGVKTTVICPSIDSRIMMNELHDSDVSYIAIRMHRMTLQLRHLIGYILFFIPEVFALKNILQKNDFDIIHCNGCWQLKGMLAAKLAKSRAIVVYHLNDTHTRNIIKKVFTFLARRMVNAFIPASERSREYYLYGNTLNEKPSVIIPAPVNTKIFNPDVVSVDPKIAKLSGLKVVTVCNVNRGKGLDELVALCDEISKRYPQNMVSFCVVGPARKNYADYLTELKNTLKEKELSNFYFMGGTDNVPAALKAADMYACVSHFESSPMAVWEAMAMGLPIVSTDVGDVKTFLEEGQCGFCLPVGDVIGMADKLSILIQDKALRKEMGKKSRKFAVENLDLEMCAEKHAFFYRELLHQKEKK
jgi:glycosyltransferase involved in cell wall biosynthesis